VCAALAAVALYRHLRAIGLFTYAVVEGLEGKGGLVGKKQISTKDLADYVIKRVEELGESAKAGAGAAVLQGARC
jgi:hypothetical protein